ncbi:hypothetical protein KT99_14321 [Shewanella benthica KT99]|uniref:Uncharacterized protein n=1 Tax=Shewanella benthica KT99 TaxID=314608 RepID=A9DLV5_9GAMM|nr:hypothetical protein KT99_14321 [Shewanella benthica KT99]
MDFIEVYPNAIPDDLCERLIACFEQHKGVTDGRTGHGVDLEKKISRDLTLDSFADLQGIRNELLTYTLKFSTEYFNQYSLALMGAVSVQVADKKAKVSR